MQYREEKKRKEKRREEYNNWSEKLKFKGFSTFTLMEEANPVGRPSEFGPEIIKKTQEYLDKCVDEFDEFHKTRGEKSDTYDRIVNVNLPTVSGLSVYLGVTTKTLYNWRDTFPEFLHILDNLLKIQEERLIRGGLSGTYNSTIAKLILTKHGYNDKIEQTNDGALTIKIVREQGDTDKTS